MRIKKIYVYEVIIPITVYGYNKQIGDLMTDREILSIPPFYRRCVKLLNSPIVK